MATVGKSISRACQWETMLDWVRVRNSKSSCSLLSIMLSIMLLERGVGEMGVESCSLESFMYTAQYILFTKVRTVEGDEEEITKREG